MLQNNLIVSIAQGYRPKIVIVHELVEEIGTEYHRLWNRDCGILKLIEFGMALDDIIEKSQATALTA